MGLIRFILILTLCIQGYGCSNRSPIKKQISDHAQGPAFPIVTIDPVIHAYSQTEHLYNAHLCNKWRDLPLLGVLRVDGTCYRFMGIEQPRSTSLVPCMSEAPWKGKVCFSKPTGNWMAPDYIDNDWETKLFCLDTVSKSNILATQGIGDIWLRRTVVSPLPKDNRSQYILKYHSAGPMELFVNGQEVASCGPDGANMEIPLNSEQIEKEGDTLTIALHCTRPSQYSLPDFGIYTDREIHSFETTAQQTGIEVAPTQTHYRFTCGPIELDLNFIAPVLPRNDSPLNYPLNYIEYKIRSLDGKKHEVQFYIETEGAPWSTRYCGQPAFGGWFERYGLLFFRCGSLRQPILGETAAANPIDWGYFYFGAENKNSSITVSNGKRVRQEFSETGTIPPISDGMDNPVMSFVRNEGFTNKGEGVFLIGYDHRYPIRYNEENIRSEWDSKDRQTPIEELFVEAVASGDHILRKCSEFDENLQNEAEKAGGSYYAALCSQLYRSVLTAHTIVHNQKIGTCMFGSYQAAGGTSCSPTAMLLSSPLLLYANPAWGKALLEPVFIYMRENRNERGCISQDLGYYPIIGSSTNPTFSPNDACALLILTAFYATLNDDPGYVEQNWDLLEQCTDVLLKIIAIRDPRTGRFIQGNTVRRNAALAMIARARLATLTGKKADAEKYDLIHSDILKLISTEAEPEEMLKMPSSDVSFAAFGHLLNSESAKNEYAKPEIIQGTKHTGPWHPAEPTEGIVYLELLMWKYKNK